MKSYMLSPSRFAVGLTFAMIVCVSPSWGATKIWDGGAATLNWADANNWNTDGIPAKGDIVQFNNGAVTAGSTVAVNVGTFNSPTSSLTLNNGAGFTLNFGAAGGNYNYFATVTVSDANSYGFSSIPTKSFTFVTGVQNLSIATGGKLTVDGNFVVGSYGGTVISKTGGGELDISTGITNFESTSRIAGISAAGGIVRAAVKPNTKWTMGSGVSASSGSQIFLTGNGSVASVGSTAVTVAGSLTLSGVVLLNDALNTNWSGSTAGTFTLIDNGGIDLRGQSISIDKLTGTGKIYNSYAASGQKTLTVGTGNGSSSFDGVIYGDAGATGTQTFFTGYDGNSGSLGLAKTGTGTLTLTGANVYSGPTAIKNGTLILAGGNDRLGIAGTVVLGDTSTTGKLILGNATAAANQTLSGLSATGSGGSVVGAHISNTSTLTLKVASGTNTFGGSLGGTGTNENNLGLTKEGIGTLELLGRNTYLGPTIVSEGVLRIGTSGSVTIPSALPVGLQIMPLGDSITYGAAAAGYRGYLFDLLNPIAPGFQFVGASTLSAGNLQVSPIDQRHHNGYSSYATLDISNNLDSYDPTCFNHYGGADRNPNGGFWLTGGNGTGRVAVSPDVILLLCGTNDINQGGASNPQITVANYQTNLITLIQKIVALRPSARLIVSKITPYPAQAATVASMNSILTSVVSGFQTQGVRISIVEMNSGFPTDGISGDGVHPTTTGYNYMANQWKNAILTSYAQVGPAGLAGDAIPAATTITVKNAATLDLNGNAPSISGLSLEAGSTLIAQIDSSASSSSGVHVLGNATIAGALTLKDVAGIPASLSPFTKLTLLTYSGTLTGEFTGHPEGSSIVVGANTFKIRYTDSNSVTLQPMADYTDWLVLYPSLVAEADKLPTADPDHDGLTNESEYAFGLDPTNAGAVSPIISQVQPSNGRFSYTRRDNALTGLTYKVWTSTDLVEWNEDEEASQDDSSGPNGQGVEAVVVTLSDAPLTAPRLFIRMSCEH